jgi:hypothetical protein
VVPCLSLDLDRMHTAAHGPAAVAVATPADVAAARALLAAHGHRGLARLTGIDRRVWRRILEGLPVRRGTLLAVRLVAGGHLGTQP